jgi:hypothetical protein
MLRVRIKIRSGAYGSSRPDTDYAGGGGQEFIGRPTIRGTDVLTTVCVQADLNRSPMCKVLRAVESPFIGYNDLQEGFEGLWSSGDREVPVLRAITSRQLTRVYA